MKQILTIQDISCVGRCSLTVALPVISCMGIETSVVPTAVLSMNSAFEEFTFRDLTEDLDKIRTSFSKMHFHFDAIYSGYLGSRHQLQQVKSFFQDFSINVAPKPICFVDPVMGDEGKLYKGFTQQYADEMLSLCSHADVIVPNLTEACLLTHTAYRENFSKDEIQDLLKKLADSGAKKIILTGADFAANEKGVMCYDSCNDSFFSYYNESVPGVFYGTGDIFASCTVGALIRGFSLEDAAALATDFVLECIKETLKDPDRKWYGVNFESALPYLILRLHKDQY